MTRTRARNCRMSANIAQTGACALRFVEALTTDAAPVRADPGALLDRPPSMTRPPTSDAPAGRKVCRSCRRIDAERDALPATVLPQVAARRRGPLYDESVDGAPALRRGRPLWRSYNNGAEHWTTNV